MSLDEIKGYEAVSSNDISNLVAAYQMGKSNRPFLDVLELAKQKLISDLRIANMNRGNTRFICSNGLILD